MTHSPIDRYLDQLFVALRTNDPRDARSLLAEAEGHLREAADDAERTGLPRADAEALAVQRFGEAHRLAATDRNRTPTRLVIRLALSAWSLGCLGAIAVGLSGIVAGLMRWFGASTTFIAGTRATTGLRPADCARWLAGDPHARTCAQAALNDWTWEIIVYRIALGVIGTVGLAMLAVLRRRSLRFRAQSPLPDTVVDTVATTIFGIAAVWLTGLAIDAWHVNGGSGVGFWLSAAPVALVAAMAFGRRLVHDLDPAKGNEQAPPATTT